jgi:hypothetical protein
MMECRVVKKKVKKRESKRKRLSGKAVGEKRKREQVRAKS